MNSETREMIKTSMNDYLKDNNPFAEYVKEYKATVAKDVDKRSYALTEAMYSGVQSIAFQWSMKKPLIRLGTRCRFLLTVPKDEVEEVANLIIDAHEKYFNECVDEIVSFMDREIKQVRTDDITPARIERMKGFYPKAAVLIDDARKRLAKAA